MVSVPVRRRRGYKKMLIDLRAGSRFFSMYLHTHAPWGRLGNGERYVYARSVAGRFQ